MCQGQMWFWQLYSNLQRVVIIDSSAKGIIYPNPTKELNITNLVDTFCREGLGNFGLVILRNCS
jgi:hypothetical protein